MAMTLEDKAVQLHKAGKTDAEISSRLGVEERIIHRWVSPAAAPGSFFGRGTKDRAQLHRALDAVMDRAEGRRVGKDADAHVGMLGVNADKAKSLAEGLKRKGFEYRFPMEPPKEDIVHHAFVKRGPGEGIENRAREWRILHERKNGFHNVTALDAAKDALLPV